MTGLPSLARGVCSIYFSLDLKMLGLMAVAGNPIFCCSGRGLLIMIILRKLVMAIIKCVIVSPPRLFKYPVLYCFLLYVLELSQ